MGWAIFALLAALVGTGLILARMPRPIWELVGAALLLGAAGYAWQGNPMLGGDPRNLAGRLAQLVIRHLEDGPSRVLDVEVLELVRNDDIHWVRLWQAARFRHERGFIRSSFPALATLGCEFVS